MGSSVLAVMAIASTALSTVGYAMALRRVERIAGSPYMTASVAHRVGAAAVDLLLVATPLTLYERLGAWPVLLGAVYLVLRDSVQGRSVGKLLFGLMVVSLRTGRPGGYRESIARNVLFLAPPPVVVGAVLELHTLTGDPRGRRLGDHVAATQVVEGHGLMDLVDELQREHAPSAMGSRRAAHGSSVDCGYPA